MKKNRLTTTQMDAMARLVRVDGSACHIGDSLGTFRQPTIDKLLAGRLIERHYRDAYHWATASRGRRAAVYYRITDVGLMRYKHQKAERDAEHRRLVGSA